MLREALGGLHYDVRKPGALEGLTPGPDLVVAAATG